MREEVRIAKETVVAEIAKKFSEAKSAVIVEYHGLTVADISELRRNLRAENVDFVVYKNSMAVRAVAQAGYEDLKTALVGPNAFAFSDDAIAACRILATFAKKRRKLLIKAGIVEGNIVDETKIKELALLPNKDGMIAMILGCFQAPIRNFAYALQGIADQKSE